ncbi:nuclear transport factor 2 family protein [Streptomyces sp. NPDC005648]|uniref:YybH family protein n=1 Tax=Streptomyces sp. NPDC005648 TaxID=3157044 RepID=UPI0033BC6573
MPAPTAALTAALTEFIRAYERATNSHDTAQLIPLIAPEAVYWFTDGSHRGREAVLSAIARTFATIRDEIYRIDDLEWIAHSDEHAVCRYRFTWTGTIDGEPRSGSGRGTNVLVNNAGTWQMLHEHLST